MSFGFYRGNRNALLADALKINGITTAVPGAIDPAVHGIAAPLVDTLKPSEKIGVTDVGPALMSRKHAEQMGFTGDQCDNCNSMKMKRTGHCNTCDECGTTTGCS